MPEKFFDIIPPEKVQPKEMPKVSSSEEPIIPESRPVVKKKRYLLKGLGLLTIVLVIGIILSSFLFAKAEVNLWPETQELALSETIIVDLNSEEIDLEAKVIPAQIVENEKNGSQEFETTGKTTTEGKASGTITVYNAYSSSSRTLIPSRFVSADGKLFRSVEKIKVPGYTTVKGKIVPGEKQVEVVAAESGSDYNIEATTFALPALAGTALYTTIYAKSFNGMTGGHKGEVGQLTKEDLEKAEIAVSNKLKKESIDLLKASLSSNLILPEETVIQDILSSESSHSVGTGTDSFTIDAGVKSKGIVFKKSDIDKFIQEMINLNIEEGQIIREETMKINYLLQEIDLEEGKIVIDLDVKVDTYDEIDLDKLEKSITGKKVEEARLLLNSLDEIGKVELISKPFTRKSIPDTLDRIDVNLKFD